MIIKYKCSLTEFIIYIDNYIYCLLDLYQITMAYAYWKSEKTSDTAVFDLFFRQNPFQGEFTIFGGLEECLRFLENFSYSDSGKFFEIYSF